MCEHPDASENSKALTSTPSAVCTRVCTSEAKNANADATGTGERDQGEGTAAVDQGDPLAKLAAAVLSLSPADRERLATMLTGAKGRSEGKAPDLEANVQNPHDKVNYPRL
jgi:hypothetical protein